MNSIDDKITNPLVGTYVAITSLVLTNIFIALLSATFTNTHEKAEAYINFQRAVEINRIEKSMSFDERKKNINNLFTDFSLNKELRRTIHDNAIRKDKMIEAVNDFAF
jgi:hypothetical protein